MTIQSYEKFLLCQRDNILYLHTKTEKMIMKLITGYLTEEELVELKQDGLITWVQYVEHHDENMTESYHNYCRRLGLDNNKEDSAIDFLKYYENLLMDLGDIDCSLILD